MIKTIAYEGKVNHAKRYTDSLEKENDVDKKCFI